MVLVFSIILAIMAVGLLFAAALSKKHRKRLIVAAALVLLYAVWKAATSTSILGAIFLIATSIVVVGGVAYALVHLMGRSKRRTSDPKLLGGKRGVLGKVGVAVTPLRPTGTAEIEGSRVVVSTDGEYIAAGSYIRVVAKDRKQYFVRLAEPSEVVDSIAPD